MEVLVAVVVLSIGAAGIGHTIVGFVQMKEREAKKGRSRWLRRAPVLNPDATDPTPLWSHCRCLGRE